MNEEHLIKFASEICKTEDLLWNMMQVVSLEPDVIEWLCERTQSSMYDGVNFYDALLKFSRDYLENKGIAIESDVVNFDMDSYFQNRDYINASSSYFDNMINSDNIFSRKKGK